ncbi:TlpA family protein disulfide reductase [Flavobacterium sp.]|uniref:TlpA family protein disulfide reductase n=2 Tax=Flavobacterium sp. TaxID=239 RepID=UPI004047B0E3
MKKTIILFLFISNILFSQNFDEGTGISKLKIGDKVPNFEFVDLDGKLINFNEYKGKYVLINFFASWCAPCVKEMPLIENEIWKSHKNSDDFIILSFGRGHSNEEVKKFILEKGFSFPIFSDQNKKIFDIFALSFIPRNYIIDKDGIVIYSEGGFRLEEFNNMKKKIEELTKK